jgi:serine phosphatase RsbU (regulator of sigma subunit)/anti-sigma regulatory factor (Ser/Thr protein kinase)
LTLNAGKLHDQLRELDTVLDMTAGSLPELSLAAFEQAPAALFVFRGSDHLVVGANRMARAFTGDRPNLVGRPIREAMPELAGQQIFELIEDVYVTGQPVSQPERRVLVDRNGDGSLEEGFFAYTFIRIEFPDGELGIVVHATETTDFVERRRVAERRADRSEERYRQARDVVVALQEHLLPPGVPILPTVELAARYVVADRDVAAGGDLFDALPMPDGRVVLVVGDVVGHGASAAATMGQLRAVALQALDSGADLAETVGRLNGLAARLKSARGATVCLVELDPLTGGLRYVTCAHPAPLILQVDRNSRYLTTQPGLPLGVDSKPPVVGLDRLAPGEQLLLYSDGLVEKLGRTLGDGLSDLARVALAARHDPLGETSLPDRLLDRVCALVIERMGVQGYGDDVTLLAAELLPDRRPELHRLVPARADQLSGLRAALREWLNELGVGPDDLNALLHAAYEACTNVIEHAYPPDTEGEVCLDGVLGDDGSLEIVIRDHGHWRTPPVDPGTRGRGLMLMRGLLDAAEIKPGPDGTEVLLRHAPWRPVAVGAPPVPARSPAPDEVPFAVEVVPDGRLTLKVAGPVDHDTVDQLRAAIGHAGRGGGLDLTVDLAAVTHLASTGLQLLHTLNTGDGPAGVHLVAPLDSTAHQALVLSGLIR